MKHQQHQHNNNTINNCKGPPWFHIVGITLLCLGMTQGLNGHERFDLNKEETTQETYEFAPSDDLAPRDVYVDIICGAIRVEGYAGDEIKIQVRRTIEAKNQNRLEQAQAEVHLDVNLSGSTFRVYQDGPFREQGGRTNYRGDQYYGYRNRFDVILKIPKDCSIDLKTVTEGDIEVIGIEGDFDLSNVNGEVTMNGIRGTGNANTINGGVYLQFIENPDKNCTFQTINGPISVQFDPELNADILVKTMHGDAYTDFDIKAIPSYIWNTIADVKKRQDSEGLVSYRTGGFTGIRTGVGGPFLKFDTLNGTIEIFKNEG